MTRAGAPERRIRYGRCTGCALPWRDCECPRSREEARRAVDYAIVLRRRARQAERDSALHRWAQTGEWPRDPELVDRIRRHLSGKLGGPLLEPR